MKPTVYFVLQTLNLSVGIAHGLVQADVQIGIFLCQGLVEVLLVVRLLCSLICPEAKSPSGAFHYDVWAEAAEDTRLVVLAGVEIGDHSVVWLGKLRAAGWTGGTSGRLLACQTQPMNALQAENVT